MSQVPIKLMLQASEHIWLHLVKSHFMVQINLFVRARAQLIGDLSTERLCYVRGFVHLCGDIKDHPET